MEMDDSNVSACPCHDETVGPQLSAFVPAHSSFHTPVANPPILICPPTCCRYYHALKPCVHYLPFWQHSEEDVLDLLHALRGNPANDLVAQRIAANAQLFAVKWLDEEGQYKYLQMLIDRYVALYRGSTSPATQAAKEQAEQIGRAASKAGSEADARCKAESKDDCWGLSWEVMVKALITGWKEAGTPVKFGTSSTEEAGSSAPTAQEGAEAGAAAGSAAAAAAAGDAQQAAAAGASPGGGG